MPIREPGPEFKKQTQISVELKSGSKIFKNSMGDI